MDLLLDVSILLDVVLDRKPFVSDAQALLDRIDAGQARGFVAATTLVTVHYVVRKSSGLSAAHNAVALILQRFPMISIDHAVMTSAIQKQWTDFEDAVQDAAAEAAGLSVIVTRDAKGFVKSTRRIVDPAMLVQEIDQASGKP